ncbi:MAG: biotin/lipoyl-containing protein, partial [Gammaproteobacteria bacterium]|nr:biotin/lipoyl-containing protein [Gammaproteobacteria bacterium]
MSKESEVKVPDIGDFSDVPVIEILVSVGDTIAAEDPLVTLESDKATMDVPAPFAGTVKSIDVAVGDTVSEGSVIMHVDADGDTAGDEKQADESPKQEQEKSPGGGGGGGVVDVKVPDIGDFSDVPVIE